MRKKSSQKKGHISQKKGTYITKKKQTITKKKHGVFQKRTAWITCSGSVILLPLSGVNIDNRPAQDRSVVRFGILRESRWRIFNFAVICG